MALINDRIKERRQNLSLTLLQIADFLNVTEATVQRYESGDIKNIKHETVLKLATILKCSPAYLMGWDEEGEIDIYKFDNIKPIHKKRIPMLGEIACGVPILALEDRESYIEIGTDINADYGLTAKGDSMINARILDGDIVFIREQPIVDNGQIAAVIIDDEVTLKRVFYHRNKNQLVLQAENAKYPPLTYSGDELNDIRILGLAVAFQSDVM